MGRLVLSRLRGETIVIDHAIEVRVVRVGKGFVKLEVTTTDNADRTVVLGRFILTDADDDRVQVCRGVEIEAADIFERKVRLAITAPAGVEVNRLEIERKKYRKTSVGAANLG